MSGAHVDVSIVIPAYNEHEAIGSVIDEVRTVMAKYHKSYEILVVDDASDDGTGEVALNKGIRLVTRHVRGGSGAARKTGILEVGAPFIRAQLKRLSFAD